MELDEAKQILKPWIDGATKHGGGSVGGLRGYHFTDDTHSVRVDITYVPNFHTEVHQKHFPNISGSPKPKLLQALMTYCAHIKGPDYFL